MHKMNILIRVRRMRLMDKMPFTASAPLFFMSDRLSPTDDRAA